MKHREAVVKRAYVELRERVDYLKRLAFWTVRAEEAAEASELFHLTGSKAEDIDVVMTVDEVDVQQHDVRQNAVAHLQQGRGLAGLGHNLDLGQRRH
jgi:hypothetical protein